MLSSFLIPTFIFPSFENYMEVETLDLRLLVAENFPCVLCVHFCTMYCILYALCVGPLGMLLRSSKRLYMRIFYTLMEGKTCYFTLRTMNFTTMDEDKGLQELASYTILEILRETLNLYPTYTSQVVFFFFPFTARKQMCGIYISYFLTV